METRPGQAGHITHYTYLATFPALAPCPVSDGPGARPLGSSPDIDFGFCIELSLDLQLQALLSVKSILQRIAAQPLLEQLQCVTFSNCSQLKNVFGTLYIQNVDDVFSLTVAQLFLCSSVIVPSTCFVSWMVLTRDVVCARVRDELRVAGNVTVRRVRTQGRDTASTGLELTSRWDPRELGAGSHRPGRDFLSFFSPDGLISVPWRLGWSNNGLRIPHCHHHQSRERITQVSLMILSMPMVKLET